MNWATGDQSVDHESDTYETHPSVGSDVSVLLGFENNDEFLRVLTADGTVDIEREARYLVSPTMFSVGDRSYIAWGEGGPEGRWRLCLTDAYDPGDRISVVASTGGRYADLTACGTDTNGYLAVEESDSDGVYVQVHESDASCESWEPIRRTATSSYQPGLSAGGDAVGLVYSTFAEDHYEIHFEDLTGNRHELVTRDGIYNHSPDVTVDGSGRIWVVWIRESERVNQNREQYIRDHVRVQNPERFALQTPWYRHMRCYVRRLDKEVYTRLGAQEQRNAHHPKLAVGPSGRPWVFTRYLASPNRDLDVPKYGILAHRGPGSTESGGHHGWSDPRLVTHDLAGKNSPIGVHSTDDGFAFAWSVDSRSSVDQNNAGGYDNDTQFVRTNDELRTGTSTVFDVSVDEHALVDAPTIDAESPYSVFPTHGTHAPFPATEHQTHVVRDGNESRKLVFGNIHRHSTLSMCGSDFDMDQQFHYRFAMDIIGEEFTAVTDHGEDITPYDWHELTKYAEIYNAVGRFVVFPGYEFTGSRHIYAEYRDDDSGFGHAHVITRTPDAGYHHIYQDETPTVQSLLDAVDPNVELPVPHHPADAQFPFDFDGYDTEIAPVVELFQDYRGASECADDPRHVELPQVDDERHYVQSLLEAGNRIGITSSGDHYSIAFAGVYTREHSRDGIFEALRDRRCYATTGAKIVLDFRANGELMGSELTDVEEVCFDVEVSGTDVIDAVEFVHNSETTERWCPDDDTVSIAHEMTPAETGYYYVRIHQEDEQMAWSSPIWITS